MVEKICHDRLCKGFNPMVFEVWKVEDGGMGLKHKRTIMIVVWNMLKWVGAFY